MGQRKWEGKKRKEKGREKRGERREKKYVETICSGHMLFFFIAASFGCEEDFTLM